MTIVVEPTQLSRFGEGLVRPECVVLGSEEQVFCSNGNGGISRIAVDGSGSTIGHRPGLVPNGIALLKNNEFLVANVGVDGGVWLLNRHGDFKKLDVKVDGQTLPEVNFVHIDAQGRLWLSVSSAGVPDPIFNLEANEGYIVLGDRNGFRKVVAGLGWSNEIRVTPDGSYLFVSETFGRRLLRFSVAPNGALSERTVMATFGVGDYPDGLALDADGGIWVVSIVSNRLYRISGDQCDLIFEDCDPVIVERLEAILLSRGLRRADLHGLQTGSVVNNISSIAFGGKDGKTGYIGSLGDTCLWTFVSPCPGVLAAPATSLQIEL